jgi:Ribonuclease G/E
MTRRLYLDSCPGERRGVVTLDGLPERLMIERSGVDRGPRPGALYLARVVEIEPALRLARLDLGADGDGVMAVKPGASPDRGALVEVEVSAEARADKAAAFRLRGAGQGRPGLAREAPGLEAQLQAAEPGAEITRGSDARAIADEAEDAALACDHAFAGGVRLCIEATRALTAVDVDRAGEGRASAKAAIEANRVAIRQAARLLRLKAIGGTIVIDLIGFPSPRDGLEQDARSAFAADQPGVSVLPVSRLGLLQIAKPHRERPLAELLLGADGGLSARSVAQRLVRALEREGRADPGGRITALCAPAVAVELKPLAVEIGPRFAVEAQLGWDLARTDIPHR